MLGATVWLAGLPVVGDQIYVCNQSANSITVYDRLANGAAAPVRTISDGISEPVGLFLDEVHSELFVSNFSQGLSVLDSTTFLLKRSAAFTGNREGLTFDAAHETIAVTNSLYGTFEGFDRQTLVFVGALGGFAAITNIVFDADNRELYVVDGGLNAIFVFCQESNSGAPCRIINGPKTGLTFPTGLFVDVVNDEILVGNASPGVTVYARTANHNAAPKRVLAGASTGLSVKTPLQVLGVIVDAVHDELITSNSGNGSLRVFSRLALGNASPIRVITGVPDPRYLLLVGPESPTAPRIPPSVSLPPRQLPRVVTRPPA
jgi:DNA-binding beta-propeller fold protein YncE